MENFVTGLAHLQVQVAEAEFFRDDDIGLLHFLAHLAHGLVEAETSFDAYDHEVEGIGEDKKQRVLIVDDDPGVRDGMREFLRSRYDVTTAGDGEEALDRVLENSPDLVLLDVKLPRLNGLDVCKRIKENPVTQNIRVIMMSGYDLGYDSGLNALDIGADDYLRKPAQLQEIEARIRTILKQAKRWPNWHGIPS